MAIGALLGFFQGGREKNIVLGILIGASIGLVVGLLGGLTREREEDNGEH